MKEDSHSHSWAYLKIISVENDGLKDIFFRLCEHCKCVDEISEEEYMDMAYINSEDIFFSCN